MRRVVALLLALAAMAGLAACSVQKTGGSGGDATEITLWTYPIGNWGKAQVVDEILAKFNREHPEIQVTVQYLDYTNGDASVNTALEGGTAPDIIMEGPERLVANWGAGGKLVDLSDLWTDEVKADIAAASPWVEDACRWTDGAYYEMPLCMTTHCMAINYEAFEKAGALQYIDEENHTWTTENFVKACEALRDAGYAVPAIIYCGSTSGDQGTRALLRNLYGATFTDGAHTRYTMNSEQGVKALQTLIDMEANGSITYDAGIGGSDELTLFANQTTCMSLCWNASNASNYAAQIAFTAFPMAFPSEDGVPALDGGVWGFGVFDNGDQARIDASKVFIDWVCSSDEAANNVYNTTFFPVRASLGDVYAGTEKDSFSDFLIFMPYLGDIYSVTPRWTEQRTAWFEMLQSAFSSGDAAAALAEYDAKVNS